MEIENEKLRKDILLLRNSINRGIADQELKGKINQFNRIIKCFTNIMLCGNSISDQFVALEEENKRRRDECIQLRSILAQRSGIGHTKIGMNGLNHSEDSMLQESEMIQAFEAQKVVNRQLESELTALTEENNLKILNLNHEIDELKVERNKYQEILHSQIIDNNESNEFHSAIDDGRIVSPTQQQKQQNINYLIHEISSISNAYAGVLV